MVMVAPKISFADTFSLNINIEIGIIKIREIDVIVDATPVDIYWTANKDKDTPINGPKIEPIVIYFIALKSFSARTMLLQFFLKVIIIAKITVADIIRICVAAKAS